MDDNTAALGEIITEMDELVQSAAKTQKALLTARLSVDERSGTPPRQPEPSVDRPERRDYLAENCADLQLHAGAERSRSEFRLIRWELPAHVAPGQRVENRIVWETDRGNPNAVIYATVIGDWSPDEPLALIAQGLQGQPGTRFDKRFRFQAPARPGTYRLRWILPQAFKPITSFYSKPDRGSHDPGNATWAEVKLVVGDQVAASERN